MKMHWQKYSLIHIFFEIPGLDLVGEQDQAAAHVKGHVGS